MAEHQRALAELVEPLEERLATRPLAPLLAGAALRGGLGVPFLLAGVLKSVYDLGLYALFRRVPIGAQKKG